MKNGYLYEFKDPMSMKSTPRKTRKKPAAKEKRLSNIVRPTDLTSKEWQTALRRQAAQKENLIVRQSGDEGQYGVYEVRNPLSHSVYKVVYRGLSSKWNFCSCPDFKTNQLGTCKHIEAVKIWRLDHKKSRLGDLPPYSSLYLTYSEVRAIRIRIGTVKRASMRLLASEYFSADGVALPGKVTELENFIIRAKALDPDFHCYPDVLDYITQAKDLAYRKDYLSILTDEDLDNLLKTSLYPYQKEGIRFAFEKGKSIIADEMGLGKTVQAIGAAELLRKAGLVTSVLIVCPTSLKYQWQKEIERFTSSSAVVIEGDPTRRAQMYNDEAFYKIVSYHAMNRDVRIKGEMYAECIIMDEVQRLKNWNTQIARSARHIHSDYSIVLSGTPLENKLEDLYSVMQLVDQYCLGPYYKFVEETTVRDETGKVLSYRNLNMVSEKIRARLIRRRKVDVSLQMPHRTDKLLFVPMTQQQREMHDEWKSSVARIVLKWKRMHFLSETDRRRLLLMLNQMRMVCDSTFILDQKTRFDTKVEETMNILHDLFESGDEKVVIFSQWERMTRLIAGELEKAGVRYSSLNGTVPSEKRKKLCDDFQEDPDCRVFISTDAGSTGLNLQAASLVINLDLPWNPAVLEQRIARIYRIGQKRSIQVINMVSRDSFEERMLSTLNFKSSLFEGIFDGGDDTVVLEDSRLGKVLEDVSEYIDTTSEAGLYESSSEQMETETPKEPGMDSGLGIVNPAEDAEVVTESDDVTDYCDNESATGGAASDDGVGIGDDALESDAEKSEDGGSMSPESLVNQGVAFFSGLAATLRSEDGVRNLADTLVRTDPQTGKSELRIPVPDKETVTDILSLFGKLLKG